MPKISLLHWIILWSVSLITIVALISISGKWFDTQHCFRCSTNDCAYSLVLFEESSSYCGCAITSFHFPPSFNWRRFSFQCGGESHFVSKSTTTPLGIFNFVYFLFNPFYWNLLGPSLHRSVGISQ